MDILWPHQVANDKPQGKWLLYLEDIPSIEPFDSGSCTVDPALVNPLKLKGHPVENSEMSAMRMAPEYAQLPRHINRTQHYSIKSSSISYKKSTEQSSSSSSLNQVRRKRDRAMVIRPEKYIDDDGKDSNRVVMVSFHFDRIAMKTLLIKLFFLPQDCKKKTAKCIKINCKIYNMQRKSEVYIRVRSRLWNSTLVMDYPRVDSVEIFSHASIYIPDMYGIQQKNLTDDSKTLYTSAYPELMDPSVDRQIPIWVIILGILGGLLFLAIVSFILWKLGFFKRRRPDPTLSGNLEKSETKPFINK